MSIVVKCDGGGRNNKRVVAAAALFKCSEDDLHCEDNCCSLKAVVFKGTTNDAELRAIYIGVRLLTEVSDAFDDAYIFSDSQLAINFINGLYRPHRDKFRREVYKIARIIKSQRVTRRIFIQWIRRDLNKKADQIGRLLQCSPENLENIK